MFFTFTTTECKTGFLGVVDKYLECSGVMIPDTHHGIESLPGVASVKTQKSGTRNVRFSSRKRENVSGIQEGEKGEDWFNGKWKTSGKDCDQD